jgi:hypothetical protein
MNPESFKPWLFRNLLSERERKVKVILLADVVIQSIQFQTQIASDWPRGVSKAEDARVRW